MRPVGESFIFADIDSEDLFGEESVAWLVAVSERHGDDLGIAEGVWDIFVELEEDFEVLFATVEYFGDIFILEEFLEGVEDLWI